MGGLRKYMPITWITSLLGSLALIGTPLFAGFYSKDSIIEAVHASHLPGAGFAYFAVTGRRVRHRVLFVPHVLPGVPRQGALPPQARSRGEHDHARRSWRRHARAARVALGGDGAAGAAGHSVGGDRLPDDRADAVRRLLQGLDRRRRDAPPGDGGAGRGSSTAPARWPLHALDARCRSGWRWPAWSRPSASTWCKPAMPAAIARALQPDLRAAREQVLHGLVQRERARAAARAAGPRPVEGRRPGADRRRADQRLGARRGRPGAAWRAAADRATSTGTRWS